MDRDRESENEGVSHDGVGRVTVRGRSTPRVPHTNDRSTPPLHDYEYSYVPFHSSANRSPGMRKSQSHQSVPDLMPPDLGATHKDEPPSQSFKGWLTSGILDVLGAAAGVTLSTTGKLVAPPLHVTKTLILPGLLALFVDTLDAITPPWVQDWFRILSSSIHHLVVVLENTEKGRLFSNQVYVVLQGLLQVYSAPESRQVLVDGMAASVKLAGALNTQETKEFLEQLSTLGIRLLDAASSGKAKQLVTDIKDVAWKGIEMAADPAATLALAEVTAHLCHALEDIQKVLNPSPRKQRDKHNRSIYLNPYQMENFPEQVTMEEVILSCLGRVEEAVKERMEDDTASIHSRLTVEDEVPLHGLEYRGWKDRQEQVNVELLREKILEEKDASPVTGNKGSTSDPITIQLADLEAKTDGTVIHGTNIHTQPTDSNVKESWRPYEDMEDIDLPGIPGGQRLGLSEQEIEMGAATDQKIPAVQHFYVKLDELLRERREVARIKRGENIMEHSTGPGKPRIKKWKEMQTTATLGVDTKRTDISQLMQRYKTSIVVLFLVGSMLSSFVSGLACYGLYSLLRSRVMVHPTIPQGISSNQEVVIRVIREVVHVNERGSVLVSSESQDLNQGELHDGFGRNIASLGL